MGSNENKDNYYDKCTDLQRKLESAKSEIVATNFEMVQVLEENDALKKSLQDKDQHIKKLMSQIFADKCKTFQKKE